MEVVTTSQQPPAGPPQQFSQHDAAPAGYGPPQVPAQWGPPPTGGYPPPQPHPQPAPKRSLLVGIATAVGAVGVVGAIAGGGPFAFLLGAIAFVCAVVGLARRARLGLAVTGVVLGAAAIVLSVVVAVAPSTTPQPSATSGTSTPTVPAAVQPTVAPAPPAPAKAITARDWQKIAKNPDAHVGESVIVYGYVTQFDSGTGTDQFRASVDGVKHAQYYDYETNTLLSGDQSVLGDLVQDDVFKAEVVVGGSYTYSNTMGGSTTAPVLAVTKVTAIGTAK